MEVFYPEAIIIATRGERDVVIGRAGETRLGGYPGLALGGSWPWAAAGAQCEKKPVIPGTPSRRAKKS
jgi:hypothetical protein